MTTGARTLDGRAQRSGSGRRGAVAVRAGRIADAAWFSAAGVAAIALNAVLLGLETYSGLAAGWRQQLHSLEHLLLVAFTVEILVRALAHLDRPADFFRNPWNVFDALVVGIALAPFGGQNTTLLRLLRLARVVRAVRFLPQLRIIVTAIGKSLPGMAGFLLVGSLLLYLYAMLGWAWFGDVDPGHFGSLGRAVLTLFVLMTLDGFGDAVHAGLAISPWSIVYYGSYALLSSFLLVNMLIGVVIESMDQAREMEQEEKAREREARRAGAAHHEREQERAELSAGIAAAREVLDELERRLASAPSK
ncbi:ion transporter [Streptomyces sp. NPDC050504]|uniref:ion transporter n=1 Tax=Streptomyces sp. NPDC050504 TaxID=3365618 RepID=UPI0037ADB66C